MQHKSQEEWMGSSGNIFYGSKYESDVFLLARNCRKVKLLRILHEGKSEQTSHIYHELLSCFSDWEIQV
jgi:hypothetical protein